MAIFHKRNNAFYMIIVTASLENIRSTINLKFKNTDLIIDIFGVITTEVLRNTVAFFEKKIKSVVKVASCP